MNRLWAALRFDFAIQQRYGFVVASFFPVLVWLAVLMAFPLETRLILLPLIIYLDLALVGFYFISGLVLYEKTEATLNALVITPLRFGEYLASKLISLTVLAISISLALLALSVGLGINLLWLMLGIMLMSLIALLIGFIAVAPFPSFSSYLIPSQLPALLLYLPLIPAVGLFDSPLFYLLPTHGALLLVQGSFVGLEGWQIAYALAYGLLWIIGLCLLARRVFERTLLAR
jgi:fluoroquinolone transport system permease protein